MAAPRHPGRSRGALPLAVRVDRAAYGAHEVLTPVEGWRVVAVTLVVLAAFAAGTCWLRPSTMSALLLSALVLATLASAVRLACLMVRRRAHARDVALRGRLALEKVTGCPVEALTVSREHWMSSPGTPLSAAMHGFLAEADLDAPAREVFVRLVEDGYAGTYADLVRVARSLA